MSNLIDEVHKIYITHGEARKILGVSRPTMTKWVRDGRVTAYRLGREVLIERAEVERLRKERSGTTAPVHLNPELSSQARTTSPSKP